MELELASELLGVRSDQELEQFLGDLVKGVGKALGPVGNALGGVLKGAAKAALPMVGGALGSMVAPGIGTAIGSQLGSWASNALGEYELSPEVTEFETARKVVQLAQAAAEQAAAAPPHLPPHVAAEQALIHAAQQVAPGIQVSGLQAPAAGPSQEFEFEHQHAHGGGHGRGSYGSGYSSAYADPSNGWDEPGDAQTGRWVRRGRKIVLYGV